jgi:hypothetical protein
MREALVAAFRSSGYGIAFSLALFAMPAAAQLIDESFTGNTIAGWALSGQACLTAPDCSRVPEPRPTTTIRRTKAGCG